jgi:L-serine dehydratase
MSPSALDLFTIGIGPSSSHTVGPMRAARRFMRIIEEQGHAANLARLSCDLYGSLAATGKGHGTDHAIVLGFLGEEPESVDVDSAASRVEETRHSGLLTTPWGKTIPFGKSPTSISNDSNRCRSTRTACISAPATHRVCCSSRK